MRIIAHVDMDAFYAAVEDALAPFGARITGTPLRAATVRAAVERGTR